MKTTLPTILQKNLLLLCFVLQISAGTSVFANRNIKFSVDMSLMVTQGKFNPATDAVYIRGTFNSWGTTNLLTKGTGNVYSATLSLADYSYHEYKYFITSMNAANSGWENNFPVATSGNRPISISVNDLVLPTMIYNDADMDQFKTTEHFNFHYTSQENTIIDDYSAKLEKSFQRITAALQTTVPNKIEIYIYKNLGTFHLADGYPEMADWGTGTAFGKRLITVLSPTQVGYNGAVDVLIHEFTHVVEAWKTKVNLPAWLNEGVACYHGRSGIESYEGQANFRVHIKNLITQSGKPFIDQVFNGTEGYAWSTAVAYFIAMTKGEPALAKFVENMNYADIGYTDFISFQLAWWSFLDTFVDPQIKSDVKFSVDMADMIKYGYFDPNTNHVYIRGAYNSWAKTQLLHESGTVYSATVPVSQFYFIEYKYFTDNSSAPNGGWESDFSGGLSSNRLITVAGSDLTLDAATFSFDTPTVIAGLDMPRIDKKINALRLHSRVWGNPGFETFKYPFKLITANEYQVQKPADAFAFDAGFVSLDGTINITEPSTADQKAVFANLTDVGMYYLCQSYMYFFYQTRNLPLLFKTGFPLFEAGLLPADNVIKTAVNAYGGSFSSFDVLNDKTSFTVKNGIYVAGAFGEFMNVFKNWGYPLVTGISATGFNVASYWFNVNDITGLLNDFNRYVSARFLQADENLRIKKYESTHFIYYTRPCDYALNFPTFQNTVEAAYQEYSTNFDTEPSEKLSFFTLPESVDADVEGTTSGGRITGGTAWSSGLHSTCAATAEQLNLFYHQNRHELGHAFQSNFPAGINTAWSNEGFPSFIDLYPIDDSFLTSKRQQLTDALNIATQYFGHRPTYEDTRVYPSNPYWDYYTLGVSLNYYLYKRGGFQLLKAVQMNDLAAYQSMGYTSAQAFLDDFYFDFDIQVLQKSIVTLTNPKAGTNETGPTVNIAWTPLKSNVKLNVFVSTDNGSNWTKVADHSSTTSCNWNPGSYTGAFKIKISAPDLLDVMSTYGPFNIINMNEVTLLSPLTGNYIITNDTATITWGQTNIKNLKIEYSSDGGNLWNIISGNTPSSAGLYKWPITSEPTSNCRIRLADASNPALSSVTGNITVLKNNIVGGPYLFDKNTVALFHFDNNLKNRSNMSENALGDALNIATNATLPVDLGNCISTAAPIMVPHSTSLNLTGDWTIEAWVKFTSFGSDHMYLFTKPGNTDPYESNYSLEVNPWWGNVFYGFYFSGFNSRFGVTSISPSLNQWYHVAFVRDTKQSVILVIVHDKDRKLISMVDYPYSGSNTYVNTQSLLLGKGITGYLDEVRISNVVRSFINTESDEVPESELFSVYPNPSNGIVHINWPKGISKGQIKAKDITGKTVYTDFHPDTNANTLFLNHLKKGVYLIQLTDNERTWTEKVILQ